MMEHPTSSRAAQNVRIGWGKLSVAFIDIWNEDRLERSPMELRKLVQAYLPKKRGLLAFCITTSIVDIIE